MKTMSRAAIIRRLRAIDPATLAEAHSALVSGDGISRHDTELSMDQIDALFAWFNRYGIKSPVGVAA